MAALSGVEILTPFADNKLLEFLYNVPWTMKLKDGKEKYLLRTAFTGRLPGEILWRKKSPYPKTHHPVYMQKVRGLLEHELAGDAPIYSIMDKNKLRYLLDGKITLTAPWFGQLMGIPQLIGAMVQLNRWLNDYQVTAE